MLINTRQKALEYLARCVEEALVEGECRANVFTGNEPGDYPNRWHASNLMQALRVLGCTEAVEAVRGQLHPDALGNVNSK